MAKILIVAIGIFIFISSTAFALSDKEIQDYAYKNYPLIEKENIKLIVGTGIYHSWAGLYTINKIQFNKIYIESYEDLDWVLKHELKHHKCWKDYKNIDINHKICF